VVKLWNQLKGGELMATNLIIVVFAVFFVILSSSIVLVIVITKRRKGINTGSKITLKDLAGSGEINGIPYQKVYYTGGKNSQSYFNISFPCEVDWNFTIKKETGFDRFFKKIGIAQEIDTMDPVFDKEFYITTSTSDEAKQLLIKPKVRKSINELFKLKFNQLILKKKQLMIVCTPITILSRGEINEDTIKEAVDYLYQLTIEAKAIQCYRVPKDTSWKYRRLTAFLIPIILDITGIVLLVIGLIRYKPMDTGSILLDSLKYSLPAIFIFNWLAVKMLKGRSTSHREFIAVLFLSLFAFPVSVGGGEIFLNGALDKSESKYHQEMIVKKYYTKSKNSYGYHILMQSWRENREIENLKITNSTYRRVTPGKSQIEIYTKKGRFGFEWIEDYRIQ
jgi:hypothetical protein